MAHGKRKSGRILEWHRGISTFTETVLNTVQNVTLLINVAEAETVTIMRIVGSVTFAPDAAEVDSLPASPGAIDSKIECGIQIVNRVAGGTGTARNPGISDDREGKEWMWRRLYRRSYVVTRSVDNPPDWWIPMHETGEDSSTVDIKVKRRIDLSQDELVFSHLHSARIATGNLAALEYFGHIDLRILLLR